MKILIPYQHINETDITECARLRKSLKGALELMGVEYCVSNVENFDIIHLFSTDDYPKAVDAKSRGAYIVVSALMAESNPTSAFLDFKYKDGVINNTLSTKGAKLLRLADLILVPSESAKEILINEGIENRIEILNPGINLSRFDFSREDEKELFYRYHRIDKNKKLVLGVGDYESLEGINAFLESAKKCNDTIFCFFGQTKNPKRIPIKVMSLMKKSPDNVIFNVNVNDDIYRSALLNASVLLLPLYRYASVVSILEAMGAKCEIIAREQSLFEGFLVNGQTAHIAKFSETLVTLTRDFIDGKVKPTSLEAYEEVKKHTLENIGKKLTRYYEELLDSKKEI